MDRRLFFSGISGGVLFFLAWASLSWAATVSIPNTAVKTGTWTIQVPIQVNQADGIAGFQFALVYDPSILQATGWSNGSLTTGAAWTPVANLNLKDQGQVLIGSYGFEAGTPGQIIALPSGSGSLVQILFNVLGGRGDYTYLSLTTCKLVNNAGVEIASNSLAGLLSIAEETPILIYLPIIFK
jgi:Cohesin domain